ncbi:NAC domain-containing protein 78-like [Papaver somniferum]|uniref:NAC domain-containing protein 78-like n=1 Tax=Papaver somniferum TaxID=3469 RepID=UPI000E704109|nr:NAC domain-containing protein 78-like [Papaver somniferum]
MGIGGKETSSSTATSSLAPGFRFHPTDEELVSYYLKRKNLGKPFRFYAISEIDIYKFEPWDLPGQSRLKSRDRQWYFFSALDKKYETGWRRNRATGQGYWKTTGKDRAVCRNNRSAASMKKTLVYHFGRAPRGERTNWVMHEYRLGDEQLGRNVLQVGRSSFVLCRIFQKSGTGPKNGEQYGAPFIEEEWDEDGAAPEQDEVMAIGGGYSNGSGEENSAAAQDDEAENMETSPFVVAVSFKNLLSDILRKFKLSPPVYGFSQNRENQYQAWVKVQIDDIEIEGVKFYGVWSHKRNESEMDAARTAIRYLKTIFEFEVEDVNLEDIRICKDHYESVEHENEELRVKLKELEAKLKSVEGS